MVEIWQCDPDALYDNNSEDFLYRASQKTGADGKYYFITAVPIPYPNEENSKDYRPAHIHMRISGKGQQDLITQVYFSGDPYLQTDPSSRSPLAINRILKLKKVKSNESEVEFDIILKKEFLPDPGVFRKISGIYKMNDLSLMEFYQDGDLLFWKWNGQIRGGLSYKGNNSFEGGISDIEARFELLPKGDAKLVFLLSRRRMIKLEGKKVLTYKAPGNRS